MDQAHKPHHSHPGHLKIVPESIATSTTGRHHSPDLPSPIITRQTRRDSM